MKIGIITKIGKNYGAVLQAYALKTALSEKGINTHIIKYLPEVSRRSYKVCKYPWRLSGTIANTKALIHSRKIKRGTKKFLEFREKHFEFIGEYLDSSKFCENPPECDVYISGSDQVWNPIISFDPAFYLLFKKDDRKFKRVSYAASIGLNEIPEKYIEEFKERVKNFDFVTVRENRAREILSELDINSKVTPDPTLLLTMNKWRNISKKIDIKEPYILCYFVSFNSEMKQLANKIQKVLGYKIVNLMTSEESSSVGDIKLRDVGPEEFLGLFENATFVLTSSFHGTIFSILNNKPFATILYKKTSSRVEELLGNLNLKERIISTSENNIDKYIEEDIYTEDVLRRIEYQRELGNKVLDEIIKIEDEK